MTKEQIIKKTEHQIKVLEMLNEHLTNYHLDDAHGIEQVRRNTETIHELSKFLWSFERKLPGS